MFFSHFLSKSYILPRVALLSSWLLGKLSSWVLGKLCITIQEEQEYSESLPRKHYSFKICES